MRVVSLVPSHTETLHDLGLRGEVVGRTRFCIHPRPWVDGIPSVGGTKDARLGSILDLRPDLVVADRDENPWTLVQGLGDAGVEVLWSDIGDPGDAADFVARLGERVGRGEEGARWAERMRMAWRRTRGQARDLGEDLPVFCPIWHPWMTFDGTSYPDSMLAAAGFANVFARHAGPRYFEVTQGEVSASGAEWTLLPTEPFPFHKHAVPTAGLGRAGAPGRTRVVDGEALTWFGTRTVAGLAELLQVRQALAGAATP